MFNKNSQKTPDSAKLPGLERAMRPQSIQRLAAKQAPVPAEGAELPADLRGPGNHPSVLLEVVGPVRQLEPASAAVPVFPEVVPAPVAANPSGR